MAQGKRNFSKVSLSLKTSRFEVWTSWIQGEKDLNIQQQQVKPSADLSLSSQTSCFPLFPVANSLLAQYSNTVR